MGLTKLGNYIELLDERNNNQYGEDRVVGLSTQKQIIKTKADLERVNLSSYKLFKPKTFAYVPDTSRRGDKISLAYNNQEETFLMSLISYVFQVKENCPLLSEFLFMYFKRPEFDRYARFNSLGSARETFDWSEMCDLEIELPDIEVQQKYVDMYQAMLANQQSYERGLEDLKLLCDVYIEDLRKRYICYSLENYVVRTDVRNVTNKIKNVKGISTSKEFREPTSKVNKDELKNYKIVCPNQIFFVQTTHNEKVFAYAFNNSEDNIVVSSVNEVFYTKENYLLPEYLCLFFNRKEFDRYARFHSWGSARETFTWNDLENVKIPIPEFEIQQCIVDIYKSYIKRKEINERLKAQIKDICPVLIKGALEESRK